MTARWCRFGRYACGNPGRWAVRGTAAPTTYACGKHLAAAVEHVTTTDKGAIVVPVLKEDR